MTTNFSTIKFALSKFYCRGVSHEKQRFWTICLSAPQSPPPQKGKFYFYRRLAFSDLGARLRGRTATQRSKKGSEKVLEGREGVLRSVLRRGPARGFAVKKGSEKGSQKAF